MSFQRTRVYYRNPFLHIGHLNTLLHNDNIAREHNGKCYAIIDDRQDRDRVKDIKEDFDYLALTHIDVVSVHKHREQIMSYTEQLIEKGYIYIYYCNNIENNPQKIMQYMKNPKMHFQLKLRCSKDPEYRSNPYNDPSIGYTKEYSSGLTIVLIFDYIIKVLDTLLNVTDIISTSATEVSDVKDQNISDFFDKGTTIQYHRLDTYFIHGFKYSKKNWPMMDERDPYLLTIKGLKARHVPPVILYAFYLHATQMGSIKITYLGNLLRTYLYQNSDRVLGIVRPVQLELNNWTPLRTDYVCKHINPSRDAELSLCPMSDILYIDQNDYGIDSLKLTKGRTCRLRYGPNILCTDIELDDKGPIKIRADVLDSTGREKRCIHWISAEWGQTPVKVIFYLYNWFYTGQNALLEPRVSVGYIENAVFKDLSRIYQIERSGYYVYDAELSRINKYPAFICICKLKN
jgi:glutamyl/glutaminyl-tRNA synthetase